MPTMTTLALPAVLLWAAVLALPAHATEPGSAAPQPQSQAKSQKPMRADHSVRGVERMTRRADGSYVARARISGKGRIEAGHVVIEDTLAPGDSPGCINFSGDVTFNTTATVEIEVAGTESCTTFDKVTVAGTLSINNATLNIVLLDGFVPQYGDRFDILDWGVMSGSFGTVDDSLAALPAPLAWDYSQLYISGEIVAGVQNIADGDLAPWNAPDGLIGAGDALIANQLVLGLRTPGALQYAHGDMNTDGVIDIADQLLVQQAALQ